jgi:hypothetical protein
LETIAAPVSDSSTPCPVIGVDGRVVLVAGVNPNRLSILSALALKIVTS